MGGGDGAQTTGRQGVVGAAEVGAVVGAVVGVVVGWVGAAGREVFLAVADGVEMVEG